MVIKMKMGRVYTKLNRFFKYSQKIFQMLFSKILRYTVHRFRESGSVQRKPGSGRPKVRTEENIVTVRRRGGRSCPLTTRNHTAAGVSGDHEWATRPDLLVVPPGLRFVVENIMGKSDSSEGGLSAPLIG
jgi:hypothetical protein